MLSILIMSEPFLISVQLLVPSYCSAFFFFLFCYLVLSPLKKLVTGCPSARVFESLGAKFNHTIH